MPSDGGILPEAPAPLEGAGRSGVSGEIVEAPDLSPEAGEDAPRLASAGRWLAEMAGIIAVSVLAAWLVTTYLVQPFVIPTGSMEPTLMPGDRVLVAKSAYRFGGPRRGDVVVFTSPEGDSTDLIKRVIAVAGETVLVRDGRVTVDGKPIAEPYVNTEFPDTYTSRAPVRVPAGTVWVMGDNRANSKDSRFLGAVRLSTLQGRAFAVYWPPMRAGGL